MTTVAEAEDLHLNKCGRISPLIPNWDLPNIVTKPINLYCVKNTADKSVAHIDTMCCVSVTVSTMDDTNKVENVQESNTLLLTPSFSAMDITENRDGGILKELLKESAQDEFPLLGDQVTVTYDAMFADGNRFDSSQFRSDNKFEFILGKGKRLYLTVQYVSCYILQNLSCNHVILF